MARNHELEEDRAQTDREIVFEEAVMLPFGCRVEFWGTLSREMVGPGKPLGYHARMRFTVIDQSGRCTGGYLGDKYDDDRERLMDWMTDEWSKWVTRQAQKMSG